MSLATFHFESFEERLDELKELLPVHWAELATHQDKVPLSPQYDRYITVERAGGLLFMTVRESGVLIGYFIGFLQQGLHYSTCFECRMDICFISPQHRGASLLGLKMLRKFEEELRRRGVQRWYAGSKVYAPMDVLFERIAMEPVEKYYCKWLGE
jgi:hypothetical protein